MWCAERGLLFWGYGGLITIKVPAQARSRSVKRRSGTKLGNTLLSADAFKGPLQESFYSDEAFRLRKKKGSSVHEKKEKYCE